MYAKGKFIMIGLEYLNEIYGLSATDLGKRINVSRQTVNDWLRERRIIPKKHYEKLKEIFKVPEDFFQKQVTELDKLQIQRIKLENDTFEYTYTDTIWDDEKQQEIEVDCIGTNIPYEQMEILDLDIRHKELFKNIENLIAMKTDGAEDQWDYINKKADVLEIFETLVEIMDKVYIPDIRVKDILDSVKIAKGKRKANSLFVKKLAAVIKEQIMRDKRIAEKNSKEARELLELGIYKKKDDDIEDLL